MYVTFSWSSKEIDDKIKYIENYYLFSTIYQSILSILHILFLPILASYIAVWWIPKFARYYLKKSIQNKEEDDKLRIKEIKSEQKVTEQEQNLIKEKGKLQKSKEESWDEDYLILTKKYPNLIDEITDILYNHDGWALNSPEFGKISEVNELTITSKNSSGSSIHSLTEK